MADVAAQAGPDQTRAMAHTPGSPDGADADLLGFEQELGLFADQGIKPPVKRSAGRPVGSVNRTTLQLQRLLMARGYRDPAEFLASIVSMGVQDLANALSVVQPDTGVVQVNRGAALDLQIKAATALLPYFHQKMPIAVQHSGDGQRPLIIINDGPAGGAVRAVKASETMSVHDVEIVEQDQQLNEGDAAASHGRASHEQS